MYNALAYVSNELVFGKYANKGNFSRNSLGRFCLCRLMLNMRRAEPATGILGKMCTVTAPRGTVAIPASLFRVMVVKEIEGKGKPREIQ
ncbi:hypothetical protein [Arcticibacter sp. MXS-1]|uniref:hypothetical protein n=1 Tax=Arcticibacter sp. MXS-1 TaxID=3341726 RepID=UPI0035A8B2B5